MPSFTAPEQEIEFECYCAACGAGICQNVNTKKTKSRQLDMIEITPCERCLEKARDEGESKGYLEGHTQGLKEGRSGAE